MNNKSIIEALTNCVTACNHCYTECLNSEDISMMARCIELDRDCADICQLTTSYVVRASEISEKLLAACAEMCEACADECNKHDHDHCKECAEACRTCAEACASYVG